MASDANPVQVGKGFYDFRQYVEFHRWASYWYQLDAVFRYSPRTVLEIGVGSGITTDILRRAGVNVTTFDFDPSVRADITGDVRSLSEKVSPESFDLICAFQVLEHVPFEDFSRILRSMANASRKHVLISLPHWGYPLECRARIGKNRFSFAFARRIVRPHKWRFDGQHHWEIGTIGHSLRQVREAISKELTILSEYYCPDYSYHYFFECERKNDSKNSEFEN